MHKDSRPDIVVILTDQQSYRMMSCAANHDLKTPAMDRLAASGMRFTQAYCSNPVCVPSRFSLLSGRMPSDIGMKNNNQLCDPMPEEIPRINFGAVLRESGYETYYGGKTHVPAAIAPNHLGFNYFCQDERQLLAEESARLIVSEHDRPYLMVSSFINPHDICYMAIRAFFPDFGPELEVNTLGEALKIPAEISEQEFFDNYCPQLPPNFEVQEGAPAVFHDFRRLSPFKEYVFDNWDEKMWRLHRWAYCRLTEQVDAQIGAVLDAVDASERPDNTVVIFTSDHGDMDGAHRTEHKTYFYDEAARVPLVVSHPGRIAAGSVSSALVSNGLDLLPTLCDYAGAVVPSDLEGVSFRPVSEGRTSSARDYVYAESEIGVMIKTADYKYTLYYGTENCEQLYDMRQDPLEMRNAAHDGELSEVLHLHRRIAVTELDRHSQMRPAGSGVGEASLTSASY